MFKFAHTRAVDRAVWDDDDAEQVQVLYNDGGLQQQLAAHLQNTKTALTRAVATGTLPGPLSRCCLAQHAPGIIQKARR